MLLVYCILFLTFLDPTKRLTDTIFQQGRSHFYIANPKARPRVAPIYITYVVEIGQCKNIIKIRIVLFSEVKMFRNM